MAGWLLRFWSHCNRRDFERGTRALADLGANTMGLYDQLSDDGVAFESAAPGLLMVFRRRREMEEERDLVEACGYASPIEIEGDELGRLEPALAPAHVRRIWSGSPRPTVFTPRPRRAQLGALRVD